MHYKAGFGMRNGEMGNGNTHNHGGDGPSFECHQDDNTRRTSDQSDPVAGSLVHQQLCTGKVSYTSTCNLAQAHCYSVCFDTKRRLYLVLKSSLFHDMLSSSQEVYHTCTCRLLAHTDSI